MRFLPDGAQRPVIDFTSDASGSNALGIATQATRLRVVLPDCANLGIPTMEQLGRPVFLQEYGFLAPGFHFRHGCDSMPVCFREVKGSARDGVDNDLCAVTSVAMRHADQGGSTHFASRYVNGISDRLSAEAVAALERRGYLQPGEAVEVTYRGHPRSFSAPSSAQRHPPCRGAPLANGRRSLSGSSRLWYSVYLLYSDLNSSATPPAANGQRSHCQGPLAPPEPGPRRTGDFLLPSRHTRQQWPQVP